MMECFVILPLLLLFSSEMFFIMGITEPLNHDSVYL